MPLCICVVLASLDLPLALGARMKPTFSRGCEPQTALGSHQADGRASKKHQNTTPAPACTAELQHSAIYGARAHNF